MSKKKDKVVLNEEVEENENEEAVEEEIEKDEKNVKIESLEAELKKLTVELENVKKAAADIVNRKKQMDIDKKYASQDLIKRLLVPMSYFEGALKLQTEDEAFNNFLKGFEMIYNLLLDTLKSDGLKEIETKEKDHFDPRIHEVSDVIEVSEGESEIVLEILHKGYMYKDRVIQPVKVKVSKLIKNNDNESSVEDDVQQDENKEVIVN